MKGSAFAKKPSHEKRDAADAWVAAGRETSIPPKEVGRHRLCLHLFDAGAAVHQQRKAGQKRCKRMITGQVSTKAAETV